MAWRTVRSWLAIAWAAWDQSRDRDIADRSEPCRARPSDRPEAAVPADGHQTARARHQPSIREMPHAPQPIATNAFPEREGPTRRNPRRTTSRTCLTTGRASTRQRQSEARGLRARDCEQPRRPRPARLGGGTVVRPMGARTAQRQEQHHPDQRHVHQAPHHHHGPSNQQPAAPRQENRHIVQTVSPRNRLGRTAASACCCLGRRWAVRRRRQGRSRYARSPAASRPPSHANHRYRIDLNMYLRRS